MKKTLSLWGLLVGAALSPLSSHASVALTAQSYVPGTVANDNVPAIGNRLAALAAKGASIRPPGLPANRFEAKRTLRVAAAQAAGPVAPPVDGCADIQVGAVYNAPTAPSGQLICAQFVAADATKTIAYVANLPANEEHDAHLVQVNADGTLTYLDNDTGTQPSKLVEGIPPGPVRLLLLVDSQQGAGGATFQFQVNNSTGYDSYEPNDAVRLATKLSGNLQINANLDTVSDFDYYTVTVPASQTASLLTFNGNGSQTAQLLTSPTTWGTLPLGTAATVTGPAGATLLLRVYNTATTAPAGQTYSLRVSDGLGTAGFYQFLDTESITHLVPNLENVARTINAGVAGWDHTGNVLLPPGERITIQVYDYNGVGQPGTLLTTAVGYTGPDGKVLVPLNIGVCKGSAVTSGQFATTSVPAQKWLISYTGAYATAKTDSTQTTAASSTAFVHICSETYLGQSK
ncbi:hypothetical protein Bsp3421_001433 [Burkholderia sp. FERM BP-3421]|uniref:hypothetical protein n=1 Tax=Burkholderia sp. FERM BP-3421 TaxID=1494466 RepID=UPI00235F0CB5|nr:hypothetical protein [Burkholderia sp. FERM BP-3421]WDD91506.1 hypothetical protein Bsp3421_001433 [Burkholderia sp. FERM BP-3421]